ncbi:MAG: glutamine synthetase family protein [Pontimonas sp.]
MATTGFIDTKTLTQLFEAGEVDTVVMAFTDMQGRLIGKRVAARHFLENVSHHGAECCNYLLAVDIENNTIQGYSHASWDTGYGDMVMVPDMSTLRMAPWLPGSVMVTCDLQSTEHEDVGPSPRGILKRQIARLAEMGLTAHVGTELEFIVFDNSYREAFAMGYRGLTPSTDYNVDYDLLASTRVEPLLREIRNQMDAAGMYCEGVKGECNYGQQEIAFLYDDVLRTCDNHSIYKAGAKMIADDFGQSLTFMAKYNEREGNSCHIHMSLRGTDGSMAFADDKDPRGMSELFKHFIAGQIAYMRELSLFYAPQINSYKRYVEGSFAPTAIGWGLDNRTIALRVVGRGKAMRVENRVPGGDVNPYLATSAMIAAGIAGIEQKLPLEEISEGNGYISDKPRVPSTMVQATELFAESALARSAFGDAVVDHYVHYAHTEIAQFNAVVTEWERVRGFERL